MKFSELMNWLPPPLGCTSHFEIRKPKLAPEVYQVLMPRGLMEPMLRDALIEANRQWHVENAKSPPLGGSSLADRWTCLARAAMAATENVIWSDDGDEI